MLVMAKRKKVNTDLLVSIVNSGFRGDHIEVTIENEDNVIMIGEHKDYTGKADPIKAIDDAIDVLGLMIFRLNKLKKSKTPMQITECEKVNEFNSYLG